MCFANIFAQRSVDSHLASQYHAFPDLPAAIRAGARRGHAVVCALAKMGCTIVRSADGNIRDRHRQPHCAGFATSFGTMIWSPWKWSRPRGFDFIVDFSFSAILLVRKFCRGVCETREFRQRALWSWLVSVFGTFVVAGIAQVVGAPISPRFDSLVMVIFAGVFLLPSLRGFGLKVKRAVMESCGDCSCALLLRRGIFMRTT